MAELPPLIVDNSVTLTYSFTYGTTTYASGAYYGYCTIADVKYEDPSVAVKSGMTNNVIAQEIAYAAVQLDEFIHYVYVMPYAGNDHRILQRLRELNAKLAAANLWDRFLNQAEPTAGSPASVRLRQYVHEVVGDIVSGAIRWDAPFGDATPQARTPVYDVSTQVSVTPDPNAGDDSADPIFTLMSPGTRFRSNGM